MNFTSNFKWFAKFKKNITTVEELKQLIPLNPVEDKNNRRVVKLQAMIIPKYDLSIIDPENPNDPIRKLAIPSKETLIEDGAMGVRTSDSYGDKHDKVNRILYINPYSALIMTIEYCAMYCPHYFRKRMVGLPDVQSVDNFKKAVEYIPTHFNHSNEVSSISTAAVKRIRSARVTVNNQAEFLQGVNDRVDDLEDLMNG
ncbi:hypothetical protein [Oceanispirochaeta sp. M1]|uniref:hypothetical protein n=1 Tax=Oceanispirochaeta sp. M1 TaxID=2283433 RepID=UPI000E08E324|nr:hypothetical protein [Oceanispirochaeta sp. M1]RDG30392.1 hypothetical protein DV872_16970 [Oceanispirochaeta sp. M1]